MQAKNGLTQPSKNQTTGLSVTIGYKLSRQKPIKSKLTILDKNLLSRTLQRPFPLESLLFFCASPPWVQKVRMSWSLTQPSKNQTTDLSVTIGYKLSRQKPIKSKLTILDKNLLSRTLQRPFPLESLLFFCESPPWVLDQKVRMSWSLASVIIIIIFGQETNLCYVASASHAAIPMRQELLSLQLRALSRAERNRILRAKAKLAGRQRTIPILRQKKDWVGRPRKWPVFLYLC